MTDVANEPAAPADASAHDAAPPDTGQAAHVESQDMESLARDMGWRPKDDWKGDDTNWRDAASFVKHTVDVNRKQAREIAEVKTALKGLSGTSEKILQRELAKQKRELEQHYTAAVDANDPVEARKISKAIDAVDAQSSGRNYRESFKAENPWFESDRDATAYAVAMAGVAQSEGKSGEEQLEYVSKQVRKRFPELFEDAPARREAPVVAGGQRAAPVAKKRYPAEVVQAAKDAVRRGRADNEAEYLAMYDKETA